jgi:glycerophosphoryl diester phosphodiesterase
VLAGRHPGEYLAMPDNGFGGKANSRDFLIRAYYVEPDFTTARGGTGTVAVGDFISFRDPNGVIGFPIVNEGTTQRLLTGGDIDPESMQRAKNGDYWMGDEFGPWILHFDAAGVLLEPPYAVPGNLRSPNNPLLGTDPPTHPNSRGIEAMAMSPNGRFLYATLEGATNADAGSVRRLVFEFDTRRHRFTDRSWSYRTEAAAYMVADLWALDPHRMVLIERDGGLGVTALFRNVYVVDLRRVDADGFLHKSLAVDLTAIADPDLVSLPAIHDGDVGLGDPFSVVCESIEAIHVIDGNRLLLGCDNNFPNRGRNPGLADDTELIVVSVPGLHGLR